MFWDPRPRLKRTENVHLLSVFGRGRVYLAWCWELEGGLPLLQMQFSVSRQTRVRLPILRWDPRSSSSESPPQGTHCFLAGPRSVQEKQQQSGQDRLWPQQGPALLLTGVSALSCCAGSALGSTGESHTDPGCYWYAEHAGRF